MQGAWVLCVQNYRYCAVAVEPVGEQLVKAVVGHRRSLPPMNWGQSFHEQVLKHTMLKLAHLVTSLACTHLSRLCNYCAGDG